VRSRVVIIGTGGRANAYVSDGLQEEFELVGITDPNPKNRKVFLGLNNLVGLVPEFDDYQTMLGAVGEIDGAIVCTPNHLHVEPTLELMRRGVPIALEKPIGESPHSCQALLEAKRKYNARVLIGFGMRSSLFYQKAKQWVSEGRIGRIVSVQADEFPHILSTNAIFRSEWRRFKSMSGGSLNEKCCHDLDMLNWIIDSEPRHVFSFAGRNSLTPRPAMPDKCSDCLITAECAYYLPESVYDHPAMYNTANDGLLYKFTRDNSSCIYNNGHDLNDHQQVLISFANGASACLTMDFSAKGRVCGRTLKIIGTEGAIFGKVEDNSIALQNKNTDALEVADLSDPKNELSMNRIHGLRFSRLIRDPGFQPDATIEAAFLASMTAFAADRSAENHTVESLEEAVSLSLHRTEPIQSGTA